MPGQCVALLESLQNQSPNPVHVLPLQIQISVSVRLLSVQYVVVLAEQLGDGVHHQAYRG